jgi:aldehyde:ferredoxin oxidoreductase
VSLHIFDGKAELKKASHLWGKNTRETEEILKKEIGDNTSLTLLKPGAHQVSLFKVYPIRVNMEHYFYDVRK